MTPLAKAAHDKLVATATPVDGDCGLYFLIAFDTIVYVGQSRNIGMRIGQHMNDVTKRHKFDRWARMICKPEDLDRLEKAFIRSFNPRLNIKDTDHPPARKEWVARIDTLPVTFRG